MTLIGIKCLSYKGIDAGAMKALVDLAIPLAGTDLTVTFTDCKVFAKDDRKWVAFPSKTFTRGGSTVYEDIAKFENKVDREVFNAAAMRAVIAYQQGNAGGNEQR